MQSREGQSDSSGLCLNLPPPAAFSPACCW
nr:unnamed protein product [Callosobruchus chinensis]